VITEKTIIPLRLGAFYDPQPLADGGDTLGFSVGGGVVIGPVVLDAAYQYRLNKDFSGSARGVHGAKSDIHQHNFLISTIYHF
ncbi:MAG: hypothetical protein GY859_01870, partial [Desulfobacterales bacterium]|nr:hypothetical protein [Desulfobacterales bacterium]